MTFLPVSFLPVALERDSTRRRTIALALLVGSSFLAPQYVSGATPTDRNERAASTKRLSIERLYSLPNLIGTAPSRFAWSADGRYLAFLWNDEGRTFRDAWLVDVEDPDLAPHRLTHMQGQVVASENASAAATDASAAPGSQPDDPYTHAVAAERSERDPGLTTIGWHPSDQWLTFSLAGDLWALRAPQNDGTSSAPLRLTQTIDAEVQATFSPDGSRLAFLRAGDLWTIPVSPSLPKTMPTPVRRTAIAVQDGPRLDVGISRYTWSPKGTTLALLASDRRGVALRGIPDYLGEEVTSHMIRRAYPGEEPTRQRLGLIDAVPSDADRPDGPTSIRWLTLASDTPDMLLDFAWSPDSAALAVDTSDLYAKNRRIFAVDVGPGLSDRVEEAGASKPDGRLLVHEHDPENETFYFWRIAWSRDGRQLYFLSDRDQDYHVYAVDPSTPHPPKRLTEGDFAVAEMHPIPGGLLVVANRGKAEERHLFQIGDRGGNLVRVSERRGTHAPVVSPDGRHAAVAFSSDDTPPDLFLTTLASNTLDRPAGQAGFERRVTHSPLPAFADYRWVTPSYVSFPSHVDGSTLYGRLTLPPSFDPNRRYPAILGSVYTDSVRNQWGGRTAHPTWGLDQFLAQEGYILLNVDMRGSWGRGRDHRRGIRLDYGGMDIDDLESGVRFLRGLGYVDAERVGIWGSSYGGLMTAMSLFRKPGLYAAGVAGAPATNVWHALTGQMAVMMRPQDQAAEYADSSPFLHGHGLADPLMIIHGMRDRVVLFKDSVTLVQRLIQLDKDVDLVALPNAGHGWDNEGLAQTRYAFRKLVQHFDRHLKGDVPITAPRDRRE